ncbi:MAG: zinc ABC transporter substrate-binding protein, partial [Gammaproteobacteria bacterium]|nr:zinc ABC transporter substrate-binding protein [Gammaproteobacteria bacterium]
MNGYKKWCLVASLLVCASQGAHAVVNVFTCEPEWAALANEVGGDLVKTGSATTGLQDVHHIEARPSLIARVRQADLLLCTGAGLEEGWLPVLQRRANNPRIQVGADGYMEAA